MRRKELFEFKQFAIRQTHAAMKVGTDSDLLGTLSEGGRRILDVGTGTGVLSLMLAQRYPEATIHAIEIDENAVIDAAENFAQSPFADRITLQHIAFQDYLLQPHEQCYDSVVCNPPYFDKSLENDDEGRRRARHTSSLPFRVLIKGTYDLLEDGGVFSVCIPGEVLNEFCAECLIVGFSVQDLYRIRTLPEKAPKRFVVVHRKGYVATPTIHDHCMRHSDNSRSEWYLNLMRDFHL